MGRSQGGFGTKVHLVCDAGGLPVGVHLSAGQRAEVSQLQAVLSAACVRRSHGRLRSRPDRLVADKGYDAQWVRGYLRRRGIRSTIPERSLRAGTKRRRRGRPPLFDAACYRKRNVIERLVGHLKECRRLATRYEKLALQYLGMLKVAFLERYFKAYFSDRA